MASSIVASSGRLWSVFRTVCLSLNASSIAASVLSIDLSRDRVGVSHHLGAPPGDGAGVSPAGGLRIAACPLSCAGVCPCLSHRHSVHVPASGVRSRPVCKQQTLRPCEAPGSVAHQRRPLAAGVGGDDHGHGADRRAAPLQLCAHIPIVLRRGCRHRGWSASQQPKPLGLRILALRQEIRRNLRRSGEEVIPSDGPRPDNQRIPLPFDEDLATRETKLRWQAARLAARPFMKSLAVRDMAHPLGLCQPYLPRGFRIATSPASGRR